jgi:hypothetical protein
LSFFRGKMLPLPIGFGGKGTVNHSPSAAELAKQLLTRRRQVSISRDRSTLNDSATIGLEV